uniref:Uncharacterized protein n=1 Tax=Solanum lycopersicum TaxID=4081 RepID=A0A3Q7HL12_SOLLC
MVSSTSQDGILQVTSKNSKIQVMWRYLQLKLWGWYDPIVFCSTKRDCNWNS